MKKTIRFGVICCLRFLLFELFGKERRHFDSSEIEQKVSAQFALSTLLFIKPDTIEQTIERE
jgi:hypothetical protein